MHGKWKTRLDGVQRVNRQTWPWSSWPWGQSLGFGCTPGTRPRLATLPWPWATTGSGQNGSPNIWLPRFWGRWPQLFGWWRLLAMSGGVKSLPNVKELMGGRSHALVHGFRANFLWGNTFRTRTSSTKRDTPTLIELDSCCSCCGAGPPLLLLVILDEWIVTIFFVSTHKDQWILRKALPDYGLVTS